MADRFDPYGEMEHITAVSLEEAAKLMVAAWHATPQRKVGETPAELKARLDAAQKVRDEANYRSYLSAKAWVLAQEQEAKPTGKDTSTVQAKWDHLNGLGPGDMVWLPGEGGPQAWQVLEVVPPVGDTLSFTVRALVRFVDPDGTGHRAFIAHTGLADVQ